MSNCTIKERKWNYTLLFTVDKTPAGDNAHTRSHYQPAAGMLIGERPDTSLSVLEHKRVILQMIKVNRKFKNNFKVTKTHS